MAYSALAAAGIGAGVERSVVALSGKQVDPTERRSGIDEFDSGDGESTCRAVIESYGDHITHREFVDMPKRCAGRCAMAGDQQRATASCLHHSAVVKGCREWLCPERVSRNRAE
jgi:hypothetical protein